MGQAKQRGSFEQRKQAAVAHKKAAEIAEVERKIAADSALTHKDRSRKQAIRPSLAVAMALVACGFR